MPQRAVMDRPIVCVIILLESYQMETTRLSTKGQIVLPKNIRASRAWKPGTEFTVEETGDGILLRPAGRFPETALDEVAGSLRFKRKTKTPAQMHTAIRREVMRRHDRGRH
jgi:AbrB family looped-hinge helix DNA binding protein